MFPYSLFIVITFNEMALGQKVGILISGGMGANTSVEVFNPTTNQSCVLPSLPEQRITHTMDLLTICGGLDTLTTCITFSSGRWMTSHVLPEERWYHTSWATGTGSILLLGGEARPDTTTTVTQDEYQGKPGFSMQYSTTFACSIPDQTTNTLVITGGYFTMDRVSRYDQLGFLEDLPSLNFGKWNHGCGAYLREDGTQVLLVAGGDVFNTTPTEILPSDSSSWVLANPLPRKIYGVRGINVGGVLYMTGGYDDTSDRDEILA